MPESLNALPKDNKAASSKDSFAPEPVDAASAVETTSQIPAVSTPDRSFDVPDIRNIDEQYAELEESSGDINQGINRLEELTDIPEESLGEEQMQIKPMNYLVFLFLMGAATIVDGIDIVNNALNLSGLWLIVATAFNILAQGAFAILTWILCDKYLRDGLKAIKAKKGEVQQQLMKTMELLKKISKWVKPLGVALQVFETFPAIEIIPMTIISVALVYWYSKKIPRELLAASASQMIQASGEKMRRYAEQGAEACERGSQIVEGAQKTMARLPKLNRA